MKNNKTFTLIALIIFLQFFNINLRADDHNKIDEEELPEQDPFISGNATTLASEEGSKRYWSGVCVPP